MQSLALTGRALTAQPSVQHGTYMRPQMSYPAAASLTFST
jgi:hypothetical protein